MGWVWAFGILVAVVLVLLIGDKKDDAPAEKDFGLKFNKPKTDSKTRPSISRDPSSSSPRTSRNTPFVMRWFPRGETLKIAGVTLQSPGLYASSATQSRYYNAVDPSEILIHAKIRRPQGRLDEMGYWPWYAHIEPEQRYVYLEWLASDRKSLPQNEGMLFMYYYGIERRLLVDEEDHAWGLQEIIRLRKADEHRAGTKEGRSFRRYSTSFIWYEIARSPARFNEEAIAKATELTERWTPDLLSAPLAWLAEQQKPLPASFAQIVASELPSTQRSVVTKRVPEEFADLFAARYHEEYGENGISLRVSKRPAWHTYRPASSGLDEMRCQVPNPMGIKSQFKALPGIWNSCIDDLRKLSRVSASLQDDELTTEAWEAMPDEIRDGVDHPLTDTINQLVSTTSENQDASDLIDSHSGAQFLQAGQIAEILGIERRPKLTPTQSRSVATTLANTGYGIIPDSRISSIQYGWGDLVALLPNLGTDDVDSSKYNAAACILRLGLSIALADGHADELELRVLTDHIDAVFDLSPTEEQRLIALREILIHTGSNIRVVARKLESLLPSDARRTLGKTLVVIAAASNGIDRSEKASLRKAFRALGLAPELLEETIAEILPKAGDAPVQVKAVTSSGDVGEPIPAEHIEPEEAFTLDRHAISSIMAETRAVSTLLAEAMEAATEDSEFDDQQSEVEAPEAQPELEELKSVSTEQSSEENRFAQLKRYAPICELLIGNERWSRDEADTLAREHGVMLDAAIETINDWAFEALGAPLIETEGDDLRISLDLL
tara:strand:- start:6361 stop:8700 length:2340 start_codon:yes stop_codon:yes gene_type:complete